MEENASNAEKNPGVTVAIAVPTTTRVPALSWQLLPTASRIITGPRPGESVIFISLSRGRLVKMPGRGLEPLRIAPPDPKSGASANFATLANYDLAKVALATASGKLRL